MTKAELTSSVAEKAGISKKDAEAALNAVVETITQSIASGDRVTITGFGTFEAKHRKERMCINPSTKQKIKVAASDVPAFKAGKQLKDALVK